MCFDELYLIFMPLQDFQKLGKKNRIKLYVGK